MKKDILFLCQFFYPEYISSATLPLDTAVALAKAGFSVEVLCGYPREYSLLGRVPLKESYQGIRIRRLRYLQLDRSNRIGRLINYVSFILSVALHFAKLRRFRCVVVYSNPPILPLVAALANRVFRTKVVFVSYDVYPEIAFTTNSISQGSLIGKLMNMVNDVVFRRVTKVVALSTEMKARMLGLRPSLPEHKVEVIPNWFEDRGVPDSSRALENDLFRGIKGEDGFVVSYFGNMGVCQDLDTILDAIRQLKHDTHVKFLFAGHGSKMRQLKEVAAREGLHNVTVLGFLHGQDYRDALSISDCFVVSLAEGLTGLCVPSKTYSYMMAGKPIIAIIGEDSDIARDLVENNAGICLRVGESPKMVSAIEELQADDRMRRTMGRNCRNVFLKKYTKSRCTSSYVDLIRRILETK